MSHLKVSLGLAFDMCRQCHEHGRIHTYMRSGIYDPETDCLDYTTSTEIGPKIKECRNCGYDGVSLVLTIMDQEIEEFCIRLDDPNFEALKKDVLEELEYIAGEEANIFKERGYEAFH